MRVAFLFLLVLAIPCLAQEPAAKIMLPDDAAQKAASTVIADVYKPDYEKAKTAAQKIELAKKLLGEGTATKDDPVSRFVLFRIARDIAAQQGDLVTAFAAISRIGTEFEADTLQMKVDAATAAVKSLKTPKDHQAVGAILSPLIDEGIVAERYGLAKSIASLVLTTATEGRDSDRIKQMIAKLKEVEEVAIEFEKVKDAKAVLDAKPTDPAANLAVGKFLCLAKGDWKRGITMLALSDSEEFKEIAQLELEAQPDALKIGDGWWKIAEGLEGTAKSRAQFHAGEFYRKALPGLTGLTKARVEKLVAELPTEIQTGIIQYHSEAFSGYDCFANAKDLSLEVGLGDGSRATKDKHYGGGFAGIELAGVKQLTLSQIDISQGFRNYDAQSFAGFFIDYHTAKGYSHRVALVVGMSDAKRSTAYPRWGVAAVPAKSVTIKIKPRQTLDLQNWSPDGWDGKVIFSVAVQNTGPNTFIRVKLASDELKSK
jgi:hypothetical protein